MQKHVIKCLLIDDDSEDQEVFRLAVSALNFPVEVSTASSGSEAFEMLNQNTLPDCIFLDLNMPLMNGKEFLKKIKNIDRLEEIPVMIYSTSKEAKDKTDMIFLGATQFITKPNSVSDLTGILQKELGKLNR